MNDHASFSRIAAITAIVAAPLALGASFTLGSAIEFDPDIMSNPAGLNALGEQVAGTFRWVEFAGMFG